MSDFRVLSDRQMAKTDGGHHGSSFFFSFNPFFNPFNPFDVFFRFFFPFGGFFFRF